MPITRHLPTGKSFPGCRIVVLTDPPPIMIEHTQMASRQNRENDTYYFARPTLPQHGYKDYIKPALVTQMQRFGKQGSLEMIVDVLSVNSFTARLIKEVREFIRDRKFRPAFVLMHENFPRDPTSDSGTRQSETRLAAAAIVHQENSGSTDGCIGNVWAFNLSSSLFERPDGTLPKAFISSPLTRTKFLLDWGEVV
ncbi:uncharacterized protein BKA55DRAFT_735742 [Fusarium redolens]|uniref:Uncharacterized protein n=1 Tax=Fusarium redolens TaxID=48865 RepID=A0A9P9HK33_FUSRE|nr:uncharacterized protein BKA55DRAFT_735742 [Fusarium redolens]KAH7258856.1 hypothetical protein BKA55DRAFT_735742 [Fusarium redolens]